MLSKQGISIELEKMLDENGYSIPQVRERIRMNDALSSFRTKLYTSLNENINTHSFLVGSQREGISLYGESDSDFLHVDESVLCVDSIDRPGRKTEGKLIFKMEIDETPTGYTYLRYVEGDIGKLQHALVETPSGTFLSSARFMETLCSDSDADPSWRRRNTEYGKRSGPSIPKRVKDWSFIEYLLRKSKICTHSDFVRGFICQYPSITTKWPDRLCHDWPAPYVIEEVRRLPVLVVPANAAGSSDELQWRISFVMAEMHLVRSFNPVQLRMLILLRLIAKHLLKPISHDMTSYIMKNVALWMVERTPRKEFCNNRMLFERVLDAIDFLIDCMEKNILESYMIPEKNLFAGKFGDGKREAVIQRLYSIKQEKLHQQLDSFIRSENKKKDCPVVYSLFLHHNSLHVFDKMVKHYLSLTSKSGLKNVFCQSFGYESRLRNFISNHILLHMCYYNFGLAYFIDPLSLHSHIDEFTTLCSPLLKDTVGHLKPVDSVEHRTTEQRRSTYRYSNAAGWPKLPEVESYITFSLCHIDTIPPSSVFGFIKDIEQYPDVAFGMKASDILLFTVMAFRSFLSIGLDIKILVFFMFLFFIEGLGIKSYFRRTRRTLIFTTILLLSISSLLVFWTFRYHEIDVNTSTMLSRQDTWEHLVQTLDEYGYSEKRVQERIWVNDKSSVAKTLSTRDIVSNDQIDKFLVGSLREGISLSGESDTDWMQINTNVICTDKLKNMKGARNDRVIFRLDRHQAPAGYTYLRCNAQDQNDHSYFTSLQHALEDTPRGSFLSSTKYMSVNEDVFYKSSGCIGRNTFYKDRQGPSLPKIVKQPGFIERKLDQFGICREMDFVRGFRCFCPSVLNNWLHRRRFTSWPNEATRVKVAELPYHVVPVGLAGSEHEDLQWRISFTLAEIHLVKSFNETQRKMHILLRLLARHVLKPVAPDITSYIMKNVAFWMAERTQPRKFTKDQLFDRVMDAIEYLLSCVKRKRLPNYMTPERNLLHGKFQGKQRRRLIVKLKELHKNGKAMLNDILQSQQCKRLIQDFPIVHKIQSNAQAVNYYDKCQTLGLFPHCPCSLAYYFTFCFFCTYWINVQIISTVYFLWKCLPMFGTDCLYNPLSIDLIEILKKPKIIWFVYRILARNKTKTKLLLKLKRCGWFKSKVLNYLGSHVTNNTKVQMI